MPKQNSKKVSKKQSSFTGRRSLNKNKSKKLDISSVSSSESDMYTSMSNSNSNSETNTSDFMRSILNQPHNNIKQNQQLIPVTPTMQQQQMLQQQMLQQPMMQQPMMQQPMMQQPMMHGDVDPLMINTMAPITNHGNNMMGMDMGMGMGMNMPGNLLSGAQMAQNLGNLANLNQMASFDQNSMVMSDVGSLAMSPAMMQSAMPPNNIMNQANMLNSMQHNAMQYNGMQNNAIQNNAMQNNGSFLKNLSKIHTMSKI
jgi:hypothetical protein